MGWDGTSTSAPPREWVKKERHDVLKVLQLIPTLDRSGAEKQMVMLATGLPRDRFEVEVGVLTRSGPFEADLRAAGIPLTVFSKRFKLDPFVLWKLTRWLCEKRFDVVHTWIFAANAYGRVAARRAKVPVVITSEMAVDLWKSPRDLRVDRRLARWTDKVVGNSHAVVDFYRRAGIPADKLAMIYSGIGEPPVPAAEVDRAGVRLSLRLPPDAPLVVFAGRLAAQKRVDDLIHAMDLLLHLLPRAHTVILGDGPLRERLQEMVRNLQHENAIHFLGHREDVPRLLAAADVLALPSSYEGLPNIVMEAMALGVPVAATAAPGTTELIEHERSGLLVPLGRRPELAQAIRRLLTDRDLAQRLIDEARTRVQTRFRLDAMIHAYADLYESVISTKTRAIP